MTPRETALAFVAAINSHTLSELLSLMTPNHRLVDSLGNALTHQGALTEGWTQYFTMVPDYRLEIGEVVDGPPVVLFGTASGTCTTDGVLRPGNRWTTPVAIRVAVSGSRVAEWRIFADNEPIRERMRSPER